MSSIIRYTIPVARWDEGSRVKPWQREFLFQILIVLAFLGAIAFLGLSLAADIILAMMLVIVLWLFTRRNR